MSLLTRLGRAAGENRQVNIFGAREDSQDMAAERSYQEVKQRIHQRIVDEMTPEEQLMLTSVHQDPHQVETLITDYCQRVLDENPFAIPQGEKPRLIADIRDEVLGLGPIELCARTTPSLRSWSTVRARSSSSAWASSS